MDESELPRVLQQLWGIEGRSRPGPKPAFQVSDIGRAAIKLADAGGLGALSMSKVAAELGVTTMALYRYVESKDDLYVVMLDQAFGLPARASGGDCSPSGPTTRSSCAPAGRPRATRRARPG